MSTKWMLLAAPAALLVAATALAAGAISSVTPSAMSVGTVLDVKGSGFGADGTRAKSPFAWLTLGTAKRKIPLLVGAKTATDSEFHALLVTFPHGAHGAATLHVQPKVKGASEIVSDASLNLSIALPSITSLSANSGVGGDEVTITGTSFGARRGQVRFLATIGDRSIARIVPVKSWSDTSITLVVPKHALRHGQTSLAGNVEVDSQAGSSNTMPFTVNG